jgi:glycerol-3-phosphate dehydrogenase
MELTTGDPSLLEPLPGAEEYLRVEVTYAVTHEAALHLDDVITRRTRISIESPSRGVDSARACAEIVAPVLGWDEQRTDDEIAAYTARVAAELESQKELEDSEANSERLAAPDVRQIPVSRSTEST